MSRTFHKVPVRRIVCGIGFGVLVPIFDRGGRRGSRWSLVYLCSIFVGHNTAVLLNTSEFIIQQYSTSTSMLKCTRQCVKTTALNITHSRLSSSSANRWLVPLLTKTDTCITSTYYCIFRTPVPFWGKLT